MGPNTHEMANASYGHYHGKNKNAMMASSQQHSQYGYHQAHTQSYGSDQFGMSEQKASRYGYQAHNGAMSPYASHTSSTQLSQAQHHHVRGHGGCYLSQQQHHHASNSMEYSKMGAKHNIHTKGGNMFHNSKGRSNYNANTRNNYCDSENYSGSDYDDNDSCSDDEYNTDYDSESDFDGRRRGRRPMVSNHY